MMGREGLQDLRAILGDNRIHLALAIITSLELLEDRSSLRALVKILPEEREILATMTWDAVGTNAGIFSFPSVGDLVLVGMAEGDEEYALVVSRLTSKEDKIPVQAVAGDTAIVALSGKKVWVTSDSRINLSKGSTAPSENLVLGQVLKQMMSTMLEAIANHKHLGNLGYLTGPPDNATAFTQLKASPVQNENMLSSIAFTEK